jgi:membrane-associated protein
MTPLISFLLSYLLLYKYITLFVLVFLAGLIIPIPVNILLMAVGAFSSQSYFSFTASLVVGTIANASGDTCAYLFFSRYGQKILREQYAQKYSFFVKLEEYFIRHTAFAIMASRLIGLFGAPVNFLSGYMRISAMKFILFDLIGNCIFVLVFLTLGYVMGDMWTTISGFVNTVTWIITIILFLYVVYSIYRKNRHDSASRI